MEHQVAYIRIEGVLAPSWKVSTGDLLDSVSIISQNKAMAPFITLMLTALISSSLAAPAQTPAGTLEVGLSEVGPLAYMEDGKIKGINYDILTQLEKESGIKFNYTLFPHARLIHSIENTKSDLSIFFSSNCDRYSATYEVQAKLHEAHLGIYLKEGVTLEKPHLQIGLIRGTCIRLATQYLKPERVFEVASMDQAIKMLQAGHLDGLCGIKAVIDFSIGKDKDLKQKIVLAQKDSVPMTAVICRKKSLSAEIKKKLDDAGKKIKVPPLE